MHHWTLALSLQKQPRCPICNEDLHPKAVRFYAWIAFCEPCLHGTDEQILQAQLAAFVLTPRHEEWSKCRGIVFWTPPSHLPRTLAYACLERTRMNPTLFPHLPGDPPTLFRHLPGDPDAPPPDGLPVSADLPFESHLPD